MADEPVTEDQPAKPSLIKKLALPLVLVLVSSGVTFGGLKFSGMLDPAPPPAAEMAEGEEGADGEEMGEVSAMAGQPAFFFTLYPDMLVNFTADGRPAYLKLQIEMMSHDEDVITGVEQYQAIVRNNLLSAFAQINFDSAKRQESIANMRALALDEAKAVLKQYHGNNKLEGVYFTSFVVQ